MQAVQLSSQTKIFFTQYQTLYFSISGYHILLLVGCNKEERINLWSDHYFKTFTLREGRERGKRMIEDRKETQDKKRERENMK